MSPSWPDFTIILENVIVATPRPRLTIKAKIPGTRKLARSLAKVLNFEVNTYFENAACMIQDNC